MPIRITKSPSILGLFIFLPILAVSGCTWSNKAVGGKPVVKVNDEVLTTKSLADRLARHLKNLDALSAKDPNNVRRTKEEIISTFILNSLVKKYAAENSISITDKELEDEINAFRSSYPDDLSFRRALADENLSLSDWKEELRMTLLERKVNQKVTANVKAPTADEISTYYNENKDRFRRADRVLLRQIVVDDLTKAQAIRDEAKKKNFVDLAKKYSVAPEGKNGGLVGWIEKGSVDIFDKAFALPVGGMSQVLESSYGFHIFKVDSKKPASIASLDEVRPLIEQIVRGKKEQADFSSWLDVQIRQSRVLRDNSLIDSLVVETRDE